MINQQGTLLHNNSQSMVFSDMFKAYDYFIKISTENPGQWSWAKLCGRMITYIPA